MIPVSTDEYKRIENRAQKSVRLPIRGEWDNLDIGKKIVFVDHQKQNRLIAYITSISYTNNGQQEVFFQL